MLLRPVLVAAIVLLAPLAAQAVFVPHIVTSSQKISDTAGDLSDPNNPGTNPGGLLADGDRLGGVAPLGLFDGDAVPDLAVGAFLRDGGGPDRGAVFVLTLNADGTVKSRVEIGHGSAGLTLADGDQFGRHLVVLGDVDGDGVTDLAADAGKDDTGGGHAGAVYILFLNADGTLKDFTKIASGVGGGPTLAAGDRFGVGLGALGDLNADGVPDLAVGAFKDADAGTDAGAVYLLTLKGGVGEPNPGEVLGTPVKIRAGLNGFAGPAGGQWFGRDVSVVGDLDGDQRPELAVGTSLSNQGGTTVGEVWLLSLRTVAAGDAAGDVGKVFAETRIGALSGAFPAGQLDAADQFGTGVAPLGDLDGDGIADLAVNTPTDDDGGADRGAVWLLYLNANGTVKHWDKLSDTRGCFAGGLDDADLLGVRMALLGDLSGDGTVELAVSVEGDDDGGTDRGGVFILSLEQPTNPGPDHQLVCASLELEIGVNESPPAVLVLRQESPASVSMGVSGSITGLGPFLSSVSSSAPATLPSAFGGTNELSWALRMPAALTAGPALTTAVSFGDAMIAGSQLQMVEGVSGGAKLETTIVSVVAGSFFYFGGAVGVGGTGPVWTGNTVLGVQTVGTITGAPWTVGNAQVRYRTDTALSAPNATAIDAGIDARTPGFAGHLQFVTPIAIKGFAGDDKPSFGRLNLTFVPEPAPLLGLAAGAVFLAVVAGLRLRR